MAFTDWDAAINAAMNEENPDISAFPPYNEAMVTMAQHKQIDYVLGLLAKKQQTRIDELQQLLWEKATEVFGKIGEHIEKLHCYGVATDSVAPEKQLDFLKGNKILTKMASRHYRLDNDECRQILMQEAGKDKKRNFRKFEKDVLAKGVDAYFEQISDACDVVFVFIDEAAKAARPEGGLIGELIAMCKANICQMLEADKTQVRNNVHAGVYTS